MTHLEAGASPAIAGVVMLSTCVLATGFMVRFLVALTVENRKLHSVHVLHPSGVHFGADTSCVAAPSRKPTVHSAAYVAIGVVRITTALASNAGRRKSDPSIRRPQVATIDRPSPQTSFPAEHRYRSGWNRHDRRTCTCETLFSSQQQLHSFWFLSRMWSFAIAFA